MTLRLEHRDPIGFGLGCLYWPHFRRNGTVHFALAYRETRHDLYRGPYTI